MLLYVLPKPNCVSVKTFVPTVDGVKLVLGKPLYAVEYACRLMTLVVVKGK